MHRDRREGEQRPSGAIEGSTLVGGGTSHGHAGLESDEYRAFVNGKGVGTVLTATRNKRA